MILNYTQMYLLWNEKSDFNGFLIKMNLSQLKSLITWYLMYFLTFSFYSL